MRSTLHDATLFGRPAGRLLGAACRLGVAIDITLGGLKKLIRPVKRCSGPPTRKCTRDVSMERPPTWKGGVDKTPPPRLLSRQPHSSFSMLTCTLLTTSNISRPSSGTGEFLAPNVHGILQGAQSSDVSATELLMLLDATTGPAPASKGSASRVSTSERRSRGGGGRGTSGRSNEVQQRQQQQQQQQQTQSKQSSDGGGGGYATTMPPSTFPRSLSERAGSSTTRPSANVGGAVAEPDYAHSGVRDKKYEYRAEKAAAQARAAAAAAGTAPTRPTLTDDGDCDGDGDGGGSSSDVGPSENTLQRGYITPQFQVSNEGTYASSRTLLRSGFDVHDPTASREERLAWLTSAGGSEYANVAETPALQPRPASLMFDDNWRGADIDATEHLYANLNVAGDRFSFSAEQFLPPLDVQEDLDGLVPPITATPTSTARVAAVRPVLDGNDSVDDVDDDEGEGEGEGDSVSIYGIEFPTEKNAAEDVIKSAGKGTLQRRRFFETPAERAKHGGVRMKGREEPLTANAWADYGVPASILGQTNTQEPSDRGKETLRQFSSLPRDRARVSAVAAGVTDTWQQGNLCSDEDGPLSSGKLTTLEL